MNTLAPRLARILIFWPILSQMVKDKKTLEEIRAAMMSTPQHVMVGALDAMMDEPQKFNDTVLAFLKKNKLIK